MSAPSWPGIRPDATTRLAQAERRARPAIDPPGRFTKCDRCRKPLDSGVYRLQRGHISGTGATWFICEACDRDLIRWMQDGQPPVDLGGTE